MSQESDINNLTEKILGCAIQVHKTLGPGLLESAYEKCLCYELELAGLKVEYQKPLPLIYRNITLECGYRLDILVENQVILEIKAGESLLPIHQAQLLTYLKVSGLKVGLLINFCVPVLKDGIKRLVNNL